MNDATHKKRIASACLILAPPILVLILDKRLGLADGYLVLAALALFSGLGQWEFYSLFWPGPERRGLKACGLVLGTLLLMTFKIAGGQWVALVLAAAFWTGNMLFLSRFGKRPGEASFGESAILFAGLAYLPLIMQFFMFLSTAEAVLVLLAAAVSDTAAYYAGTLWGKKKIWPQISPKKSWAGSLGGLAACMAATLAMGAAFGNAALWAWLVLGLILNLAAQFGDFFESALKRSLKVKDSGKILPGHGGLLDRIDSLLMVLPTYALARAVIRFFD
ncbi:MAG: phosphatidate cytidylyltransferase [Desulfovibrionaceae bacterium]|nr:phosphatidate cytidylyltransferase [Desulfovibrionaceae bacterium]